MLIYAIRGTSMFLLILIILALGLLSVFAPFVFPILLENYFGVAHATAWMIGMPIGFIYLIAVQVACGYESDTNKVTESVKPADS